MSSKNLNNIVTLDPVYRFYYRTPSGVSEDRCLVAKRQESRMFVNSFDRAVGRVGRAWS